MCLCGFGLSDRGLESPGRCLNKNGVTIAPPVSTGPTKLLPLPGLLFLLLTRSWLDRLRLCSRVAAALGRTEKGVKFTFY